MAGEDECEYGTNLQILEGSSRQASTNCFSEYPRRAFAQKNVSNIQLEVSGNNEQPISSYNQHFGGGKKEDVPRLALKKIEGPPSTTVVSDPKGKFEGVSQYMSDFTSKKFPSWPNDEGAGVRIQREESECGKKRCSPSRAPSLDSFPFGREKDKRELVTRYMMDFGVWNKNNERNLNKGPTSGSQNSEFCTVMKRNAKSKGNRQLNLPNSPQLNEQEL